ncbi:MAG: CDP-alcohol phosphatidyltransferase family protein [Cyclobacteriaceae bacterium]
MKKHFKEVKGSIKLLDIEETFDIYFSRFFGLFFAKGAARLGLTPTNVTVASLIVGVIGGGLLFFQDSLQIVVIASAFITLAGILDSADGQLARLTGTASDFGRMVDGTVDSLVFAACYFGSGFYFIDTYTFIGINVLGWSCGYFHSVKSAVYEFYKTEYLEFFSHRTNSAIPLKGNQVEPQGSKFYQKVIYHIIKDYTSKQLFFTSRTPDQRIKMRALALDENTREEFKNNYRKLNRPMLSWWAIFCGINTHRFAMIGFSLFGRFDLYLFASLAWTLAMIPLSLAQSRRDKKLLDAF